MRRLAGLSLVIGALLAAGPTLASLAIAQMSSTPDDRFAGLQWTFARIKYNSTAGNAQSNLRVGYWEEPWAIDAPAAEQNLTRRIKSVTAVEVTDPVVLTLDDEQIRSDVQDHLARNGAATAGLHGFRVVRASTPDGRTAEVAVVALARPTMINWVTQLWSDGIIIRAEARARAW